ncbi:hypothetical protein AAG570_009125 [Ranatra chinensis]|uniref:RNA-binding protein 5 n=1 Tax=Ranatra chinensis TaxID=642074 RepID=A0ABD0ZG71_9HEMI
MERRHYSDNQFFGRNSNHGSPYYGSQRSTEEDLVARSKEWINRQDRDRDTWRRSVDDFLDDRGRHSSKTGRDRSPRDRSRSRERGERKEKRRGSRERRGSSREPSRRRSSDDDDSRDYSLASSNRRHSDRDSSNGGRWEHDRAPRGDRHEWSSTSRKWSSDDRQESRRWSREDDDDNSRLSGKQWSADDDNSSSYDRSEDKFAYKKQVPQKTIIIRGLAQHITEHDIKQDIVLSQLTCKDIRLVRRKDTGASRGFAFVEFHDIADATKWIEQKQGELMLKDHFRALLQYSLPKDHFSKDKWHTDWYCKCQAHNFRRRDTCFRCNLSRREGEVLEGTDEVSSHPTNTVLLRGLDALTTEESVLQSIKSLSALPIRSVRIGRDTSTNTSRGVCYLEMNSVVDAMYLHNALQMSCPVIDHRAAIVSYAKLDPVTLHSSAALSGQIANAAVAAAQWSHQSNETTQYTLSDVPRLAEYSANLYASTPQEKATYLQYYEEYYKKQIADGAQISLPNSSTAAPNVGWAGAQVAFSAQAKKASALSDAPDGSGDKTYPPPDVTSYQYDKSSGYYYDPFTTLYYDAKSQYYYNNKLARFLYWDASKSTYLPAPTAQNEDDESKKAKDKDAEKDKVKVAKRIAKDMERWAKTLNQKKENAKQNVVAAQQAVAQMKAVGAADIGYAVLERKEAGVPLANGLEVKIAKNESLVAAYGQGSDSEEEVDELLQEDKQHTDWSKMACLLCKRQFQSKDALIKHQQLSDLHKQNLAAWYRSKGIDPDEPQQKSSQYRDRAKERRLKYGEPDKPQPNKLKETYMKAKEATVSYEEPTKSGIGSDNLGNKLLQKMGWQEGMGLGKTNQGRTNIIEAERRSATAGLGTKTVGVTPGPGETYKDCVKKMMHIRYNEIDENL